MKKVNKIIKFGEEVEGYNIPVLNEREIRASGGGGVRHFVLSYIHCISHDHRQRRFFTYKICCHNLPY